MFFLVWNQTIVCEICQVTVITTISPALSGSPITWVYDRSMDATSDLA